MTASEQLPPADELAFLKDMNALISQTLEEQGDPWQALKTLANEVRNRISDLEADAA